MSKIAVVYWSGTGNTKVMANAVADGIVEKGAEAVVMNVSEFDVSSLDSFDGIAFGCPAMGDEVLEESEFQPAFDACKSGLKDKRIALFGSYGWGSGEWMRNWEENCQSVGAVLVCNSVICNEVPDDAVVSECRILGAKLAG